MKQENFETPDLLLKQVENVEFLLDTTIPWMLANPNRVNLNESNSECGTFACLAGWYAKQRHGLDWEDMELAIPYDISREYNHDPVGYETGIKTAGRLGCPIFGLKDCGTLRQRKTRLIAHKESLQTQIKAWYSEREIAGVMV